jgi:flavin reductase (DIM6/NTAB) family NADH-FMN oxidoreductase RutF
MRRDPSEIAAVVGQSMVHDPVDPAAYRKVLSHHPTGVVAVTTFQAGEPVGMVAGSFVSVSLDPPLVGFLPARTSTSWPRIAQTRKFVVNVLASDQVPVCATLSARGPRKFDEVEWWPGQSGPHLAGAIAALDCDLYGVAEAGDHFWVTGLVRTMTLQDDRATPMLFHRGTYCTSAPAAEGSASG